MEPTIQDLQQNGAGFAPAPVPSGGFDAADGWDGAWKVGDSTGFTPMPSQTKIDNFQRSMAKLFVDLDVAQRQEQEAKARQGEAPDNRTAEELMAEVDEAMKLRKEVFDKFRDALAKVCSDSPSRAVLGKMNEPTLIRFINHVGRLLNPEV